MIKRYLAGIALLTVITMSGCSAKVQETTADAGTTPADSAPAAEAAADSGAASDVIEIEFWHALENQYEETLNRVVGDFNSTHDSIVVKPMYIGNYSALNEAIVSANAANTNLPGVAMANIPYVTGYGAGGLCEDLGPYIPVSYTHLDVYKRQLQIFDHYVTGGHDLAGVDGAVHASELLDVGLGGLRGIVGEEQIAPSCLLKRLQKFQSSL